MDEERVGAIVAEVEEHLADTAGPDMEAVLDMLDQLGLTEEQQKEMEGKIKDYIANLMEEILQETNMDERERQQAA